MSVLVSLFAFAAVTSTQASANTVEPKAASEKKICKVDPEDTDSRIRRRICKTAAEWAGENKKGEQGNGRDSGASDR